MNIWIEVVILTVTLTGVILCITDYFVFKPQRERDWFEYEERMREQYWRIANGGRED